MRSLVMLAAVLAALVHVLIFCMESLLWMTPAIQRRFRQTPEQAATTRLFAFNQGFYNLFLAIGVFVGLWLVVTGYPGTGFVLVLWNCLFMLGAALVLLASSPRMWRGAVIQGAMPLAYLVLVTIHLST